MKNIYKHIAATLKNLRREKGWSLDKAAEETGVSKAMLGQIEREESSPTIATLWKIASGFHTSFSLFIEETLTNVNEPVLLRAGKLKKLRPSNETIHVTPLFPFDENLQLEIFIIELLPKSEHLSTPHQPGVTEHVIVIEGEIEVLVNGNWQTLKKGEGLRFNANQPHGYRNRLAKRASFHDIIHYSHEDKMERVS